MTESAQIGVPTHLRPMGPSVIADLDTLLIALYVELTDRIIPARSRDQRRGPGRPSKVTDTELVCLAVAQVLLRYHDEHRWLRAAPSRVGTCSPGCCLNRLATGGCDIWPGCWRPPCGGWPTTPPDTAELLRLLAGTPVVCGRSRTTAMRSALVGRVGYGDRVRAGQLQAGRRTPGGGGMLQAVPANRPAPGTLLVGDKGFAGGDFQTALADLELALVRPARTDEPDPGVFPN
jgi:hypothetical protein